MNALLGQCESVELGPLGRIWVRKRWFGWEAIDPDEPVGIYDSHTVLVSRTREGVIAKWRKRKGPDPNPWNEVAL